MSVRKWGNSSKAQYDTLCPELQEVLDEVLQNVADISILEGHRSEERQNALYPTYTKLKFPHGKHNAYPSNAVDILPYPKPETEVLLVQALSYIAGAAVQIARQKGYTLRWGGDWDRDGDVADQNFNDLFHLEIVR